MTIRDPETGDIEHRQDNIPAVRTAADELNEATLALERIDYNALREANLETLLAAKEVLGEITMDLRRRQHRMERERGKRGGGDA